MSYDHVVPCWWRGGCRRIDIIIIMWCHLVSESQLPWIANDVRTVPFWSDLHTSYTLMLSVHVTLGLPCLFRPPPFRPISPTHTLMLSVHVALGPSNISRCWRCVPSYLILCPETLICFCILLTSCFIIPSRFSISVFVACSFQLMSYFLLSCHISNTSSFCWHLLESVPAFKPHINVHQINIIKLKKILFLVESAPEHF